MSKLIETYYLPTFFREKDPSDTTCTLFVRKYKRYTTSSGKEALAYCSDVVKYEDEDAMVSAIKQQDMKELPVEAEGDPNYIPEHLRVSYARKVLRIEEATHHE